MSHLVTPINHLLVEMRKGKTYINILSICYNYSDHHHRTIIVLVYLVPHALFNYDVNGTRKITEVYYFPRYLGN